MVTQLLLPLNPTEATKSLLKSFSTPRMRDVVEKRFGLKGGEKRTLEEIGKEYGITRERVRQIEMDALRQLRKSEYFKTLASLRDALKSHVIRGGGMMAAQHLYAALEDSKQAPHIAFLMELTEDFVLTPESGTQRASVAQDHDMKNAVEKVLASVVSRLQAEARPVSETLLHRMVGDSVNAVRGVTANADTIHSYLSCSKLIQRNPYGVFGLSFRPEINPRGVRDKAYIVFTKRSAPMHFREVADAINAVGWPKKKAHPQTVHNELIKDPRFVLVGRGMYALSEWGHEPGVVRDVLVSVMKAARRPLGKDEIIQKVLEKRVVKPPTILLNLQNKSLFRRIEDDKYTLV